MLTLLTFHFAKWIKARRDRAALRQMLTESDQTLDDIGLVRHEIETALGLPYRFDIAQTARSLSARSLGLDQRL